MIDAWLDPSLLFISGDEWIDEEKRDSFLSDTNEQLQIISEVGVINILWSDEMNCRLWEEPQMPPWRQESDWCNMLVPIIYNALMQHVTLIDIDGLKPAECSPELICCCNKSLSLSLRIITYMILNDNPGYHICLSGYNSSNRPFKFIGDKLTKEFHEVVRPCDWFNYIEIHKLLWPVSRLDDRKLYNAVLFAKNKYYPDDIFKYEFVFEPTFIDGILGASRKERCLSMIAKRLILTTQQAEFDTQLQDEKIGKVTRRFRVTPRPTSIRIHYKIDERGVVFTDYFPEGCHDDGL